jgi:hypothetical protein
MRSVLGPPAFLPFTADEQLLTLDRLLQEAITLFKVLREGIRRRA